MMNAIRNFFRRIQAGMTRFMTGRYGMDKLNSTLLWTSMITVFLSLLMPLPLVRLAMTVLSYGLMAWAVFRTFSHQIYKRRQENLRFQMMLNRIRDRQHKYFQCPRCHQSVRVPKGKGKIAITCPNCKERFIKKT
jgi:ribosomal protein L37AE/L43A